MKKQRVITFPNKDTLMEHQLQALYADDVRFKVLVWHRRARKTTTAINNLVASAMSLKGVYWHIFPTFSEAKDAVWRDPNMLFNIVPKEFISKANQQELVLYLKNGSIIQLKGSDDPDSLRGAGPKGIVLDEFATMKPETWNILEPILRANNGWAWIIGTPKGKNHLYDFYLRGLSNPEWKSYLLKASKSGIIAHDQLEASKETMSQALFNQEYECEFLEGEGSVFRNVRRVMCALPAKAKPGGRYIMGVDLARLQDWTVVAVYDRVTNEQVYQDRFQQIDWAFQKQKIKMLSEHYNNATTILDATGVGDPIYNDLTRDGINVVPFKINQTNKKEIIEKLSIFIEQQELKMLPIEETGIEFDNFGYTLSSNGRVSYGAVHGKHDDIVLAHALAVSELNPIIAKKEVVPMSLIQRHKLRLRDKLERQIDEVQELESEWYYA